MALSNMSKHVVTDTTMKASKRKYKSMNMNKFEREFASRDVWNATVIPDGFIMVIDTREQLPLFTNNNLFQIEKYKLDNGDYSVKGYENKICIERKMVSDFFGYLGKERDKTCEKLDRMKDYYFKALVIEANESDLFNPQIYTTLTKEHVRGFLKYVRVKQNMHVYCNSDRKYLERYVLDHLTYAYKQLTGAKDTKAKSTAFNYTAKPIPDAETVKQMQAKCKTYEELLSLADELGYKKQWVDYIWDSRSDKGYV